jgi:lysophospholipase L1-like esterase
MVTDSAGRPVPGVLVTFRAAGGGTIDGSPRRTDGAGVAVAGSWVLGPAPGEQEVMAEVGPLPPVSFWAFALPQGAAAGGAARACPIPPALAPFPLAALPRTAAALRAGAPLTVVAIGSSSTEGVGATAPDRTYPAQLATRLAAAFPSSTVSVLNRGVSSEVASQTVLRFDRDVFAYAPDLVIWQVGTNDVLRGVDLGAFTSTLEAGVQRLGSSGADVVLLDSQRFPGAGESEQMGRIQAAIAAVASEHAVPLIPRYAWMTEMLTSGAYTFDQLLAGDRLHPSDLMYGCMAYYAAAAIAAATYDNSGTLDLPNE